MFLDWIIKKKKKKKKGSLSISLPILIRAKKHEIMTEKKKCKTKTCSYLRRYLSFARQLRAPIILWLFLLPLPLDDEESVDEFCT